MTDHDPLDELASAHLDGASTPEEAARVASDPELLARVEALRAVRAAVASPPPADPEHREQAIAAALAAYDAEAVTGEDAAPLATVRSLAPIASRRRGSGRSWRVAGVAAAVAALVALVPVLASLSSDSDDSGSSENASIATSDERGEAGTADATVPSESALDPQPPATSTTAADQGALSLGSFDNGDDLVAAARSTNPAEGSAFQSVVPDPTSCLDELVAGLPPGTIVTLAATATLDGAPVAVVVTPNEVRIAGGDCTDVLVRPR